MFEEFIKAAAVILIFIYPVKSYNNPAAGTCSPGEDIIVDCKMSLEESLSGIQMPRAVKKDLVLLDLQYYSFDKKLHQGQLLIHKDLARDIKEIFGEIKASRFPVGKVIPIAHYSWSDVLSMNDNNTSCFNYRLVEGTKVLSAHALGRAIDINPMQNPQIQKGKISPDGAAYNIKAPGTINRDSFVVKAFRAHGWKWGGLWRSTRDYQHFEKRQ